MNIGEKIIYNNVEYTITIIEDETVHLENNDMGICVLKTELE